MQAIYVIHVMYVMYVYVYVNVYVFVYVNVNVYIYMYILYDSLKSSLRLNRQLSYIGDRPCSTLTWNMPKQTVSEILFVHG